MNSSDGEVGDTPGNRRQGKGRVKLACRDVAGNLPDGGCVRGEREVEMSIGGGTGGQANVGGGLSIHTYTYLYSLHIFYFIFYQLQLVDFSRLNIYYIIF